MINNNQSRALYYLFFLFSLYNCFAPSYKKLSINDPDALLYMKDSLISKYGRSKPLLKSFARAHNSAGISAMDKKDYSTAIEHFAKTQDLFPLDTIAKYNMLMVKGHKLHQKGDKDSLWSAIENYSKAAQIRNNLGEPHYYIGLVYRKLGNKDFDLIIESYNKSLARTLNDNIRSEVEIAKKVAMDREKKLKEFWK